MDNSRDRPSSERKRPFCVHSAAVRPIKSTRPARPACNRPSPTAVQPGSKSRCSRRFPAALHGCAVRAAAPAAPAVPFLLPLSAPARGTGAFFILTRTGGRWRAFFSNCSAQRAQGDAEQKPQGTVQQANLSVYIAPPGAIVPHLVSLIKQAPCGPFDGCDDSRSHQTPAPQRRTRKETVDAMCSGKACAARQRHGPMGAATPYHFEQAVANAADQRSFSILPFSLHFNHQQ